MRQSAARAVTVIAGVCLAAGTSGCTDNDEDPVADSGGEIALVEAGPLAAAAEALSQRYEVAVIAPSELPTASSPRKLGPVAGLEVDLPRAATGVVLGYEESTLPERGNILKRPSPSNSLFSGAQGCGKFLWYVHKGFDDDANDFMEVVGKLLPRENPPCARGWHIIS